MFSSIELPWKETDHAPLETLDRFLSLIDAGMFFECADEVFFKELREAVADALSRILIRQRPFLEATRGLHWPYEAFKKRVSFFEKKTGKETSPFVRRQARLFLALLPFPGQWGWLISTLQNLKKDPEVKTFLKCEKQTIQEKLSQKGQKQFKLRHFCQILKRPRLPEEKGVLRIFSLPYLFIDSGLLMDLNRHYVLFVEPPMGIIFRHTWWRTFSTLEDPCLFGVGSQEDVGFLRSQPGTLTTNLAHGDFLDHTVKVDFPAEKHFDLVFNSTFDDMPRKRHELMLTLLRHPCLSHTTALFLGRGKEANINLFKHRIHQERLEERVTLRANLPREDIPKQLAFCKTGVNLSLYENGCRSIYEFFRSDLPCVISSSMAGMNLEIFNPRTGLAVPDRDLPEAIARVIRSRDQFAPRKWFLDHSGSFHSTKKLNDQLKRLFQNLGYRWSDNIVPLLSSGASRYANASHMAQFRRELEQLLEYFQKRTHLPISLSID